MGWYGTLGATKQDIIGEVLDGFSSRGLLKEHALKKESGETVLWMVIAGQDKQNTPFQCILCYLIYKSGRDWGYKPLDEMMVPYYTSVPIEWLDKYPCIYPGGPGDSDKWRADVRKTKTTNRTLTETL